MDLLHSRNGIEGTAYPSLFIVGVRSTLKLGRHTFVRKTTIGQIVFSEHSGRKI
jgi:hypothetical protein